jgi:hypothetical protein
MKELEGHRPPGSELFGAEHLTHAALADHLEEAVAAI